MKDVPEFKTRVADYQFQIVISGFLDGIGKRGVIIDINYAKDFIVLIAYCAGLRFFPFFCKIYNAYGCAATLFAANFYMDRRKI